MLLDRARRAAVRLDASYTEDLVRLYRASAGTLSTTPIVSVQPSIIAPNVRIAIIAHVFYPELLEQLRRCIANLPHGTDVYISVPNDSVRLDTLEALEPLELGLLDIRVVGNRGRDIAPKYVTFTDVYDRGYYLLLFLHTKKSLTAHFGNAWRDQLFRSLAGSPAGVNGILRMFQLDDDLGIVAPAHHEMIGSTTGWDGNYREAKRLAKRAGLAIHRWAPPDFASGSMFWARPEALQDLTGLGLRIEDFPAEDGQVGVTIMHALERLTFVAADRAGYRSLMVADPGSAAETPSSGRAPERVDYSRVRLRRPPGLVFVAATILTTWRITRKAARWFVSASHTFVTARTSNSTDSRTSTSP